MTFTAGMGGATTEGTWTLDNEKGELVLTISKMMGPNQQEMPGAPSAWSAYLNDDNGRLSFYPAPPDAVA